MKKLSRTVSLIAALSIFAVAAQAQLTVFSDNYEGYTAGTSELAPWSDTGDLADNVYSLTVAAGAGTGGSQGLYWQANFRPWSWSGWMQAQMGYSGGNPSGNTSVNLSDYTLSFDMEITGGQPLNNLQLNLQGWSGAYWSGAFTETGGKNINTGAVTVGGGWDHISVNLGALAAGSGFDPSSQTYQFQWQVNGWEQGEGGSLGEKIAIDNVEVTMLVPEPSTLALIGLGAAGLFWLRRKNS